jgi:hypothetical protein
MDHRLGPYVAFGRPFLLSTPSRSLAGLLSELYAPLAEPDAGEGATEFRIVPPTDGTYGSVHRDGELLGRGSHPATVLGKLIWAVNQLAIGSATDRLVLHAAAADLDGTGVLIPAQMESGKTTLVTGLLDRGLGYLTDEAASVTTDLVLEGYAKPLSIDPGSWDVLPHHRPTLEEELAPYLENQWQIPPDRFAPVLRRTRLGLIVFRRYAAGTPMRLEQLDAADALEPAIESTFIGNGPYLTTARVRELAAILDRVPAFELVGGELAEACEAVIGQLRTITAQREASPTP